MEDTFENNLTENEETVSQETGAVTEQKPPRKKSVRTAEEKRAICNRLNKIAGQVQGVTRMINNDRYCDDVLIQLSAVNSSIKSVANLITKIHINSYVSEKVKKGKAKEAKEAVDELIEFFKLFQ